MNDILAKYAEKCVNDCRFAKDEESAIAACEDNIKKSVAEAVKEATEPLVEALDKVRDLQDQANSTLRDPHITAAERKTYLINNQFEVDRVCANALAAHRAREGR